MADVKPSKWPEQRPAHGENPFDFCLRMALMRRRNEEETAEAARKRRRDEIRNYRWEIVNF